MAIRLSGLSSGLDTEALVGALMSAQSMKKTKVEQSKTKLEWKQTKWKDLNDKLYKLYNEQVTKMQLQSSYMTKKASVSDATKASVTADVNAVNGSYTLEIENIATSQYLTGGKINASSGDAKLSDLDPSLVNKEINVTVGGKESRFTITADTTLDDFTSALKDAGLNANFDATQKRLFISSKNSGLSNAFSLTTTGLSSGEVSARSDLRDAVGYSNMSAENKKIVDGAMQTLQNVAQGSDEYNKALQSITQAAQDTSKAKADSAASKYMKAKLYSENYDAEKTAAQANQKDNFYNADGTIKDELKVQYGDEFDRFTDDDKEKQGIASMSREDYITMKVTADYDVAVAQEADTKTVAKVNDLISNDAAVKTEMETIAITGMDASTIEGLSNEAKQKYYGTGNDVDPLNITGFDGTSALDLSKIEKAVSDYTSVSDRGSADNSALSSLGLANITIAADGSQVINGGNGGGPSGMALIAASDSVIKLNGAELTSSTAAVSANGLNINLTGLTKDSGPITFSVTNDVDSVYNSVKNMLKEYNNIMKEMNTLYSAPSAKGYEPLSSEQKKEMSDDDIKLWEDKIKDSLLRSDTTLNSIMSGMKNAMMSSVQYEGKNYSLASFGIMTSTDYTEGGLYHIYGDSDDAVYGDRPDKLKAALEQNPEEVVNVLSKVFGNLRSVMSDKMAGSKVSSSLTFYSDIKMKDDLKAYEKDIKSWENKLADMEDAYYKKFTALETAMAKLQSQQSNLSALFGM